MSNESSSEVIEPGDVALMRTVRDRNATYPRDVAVGELFARQRYERPDALAVVDHQRRLTYGELDTSANAIAHSLVGSGVEIGQRVAVVGGRSADAVVALLGVLKAGAAYVPLDIGQPAARLAAMVRDADVRAILALPGSEDVVETSDVPCLRLEGSVRGYAPPIARRLTGTDLAYVMFTSGSTGRPKAVGVRHRGIARLVVSTDYVEFTPCDRVLHVSSLSFDASTFEIWGALLNGARLVVADSALLFSAPELEDFLRDQAITSGLITTAAFHHLAHERPGLFRSLDQLVVGGEALSAEAARRVLAAGAPTRFVNAYGPTENSVITTAYSVHHLQANALTVPIGRPIANTTCHVVRQDGSLADVAEQGELLVGGDGVAAGYLNDAPLTLERFVDDPFSGDPDDRLYRTGDLASWREDGILDFHGRLDRQFKIHGYRVEPAEVEAALLAHPAVRAAAVMRLALPATADAEIIAYVVPTRDAAPTTDQLKRFLRRMLPPYMIPAVFATLDMLPMTASGKIDHAALPLPTGASGANGRSTANRTPVTVLDHVLQVWFDVLSARGIVRTLDPEDTLFAVGGTSFDVPLIHTQVVAALDVPGLRAVDLFAYPTAQGYAERIERLRAASEGQFR